MLLGFTYRTGRRALSGQEEVQNGAQPGKTEVRILGQRPSGAKSGGGFWFRRQESEINLPLHE